MNNTIADILDAHIALLSKVDSATEDARLIADAKRFVEQISNAGSLISDTAHRSQLRSLIRFWSSWIYDAAGTFTDVDLRPVSVVLQKPAEIRTPRIDWSDAPDISDFVGRGEELKELSGWITKDRIRLVLIQGIGGIGKSTLAKRLTKKIAGSFEQVIWRDLRNAPEFRYVAREILLQVSPDQHDLGKTESIEMLMSLLLEHLRQHSCLIVLDNMETILGTDRQAITYRDGYEHYSTFFQRVCRSSHSGCVLVTSREEPEDLTRLRMESQFARTLVMQGLGRAECKVLLSKQGISGTDDQIDALVRQHGGNPLALRYVSASIRELFAGNVAEYLDHGIPVFGAVRDLLKDQFDRLTEVEKCIVYWMTVEREYVSVEQLLNEIVSPLPRRHFLEGLQSLQRRSLVETTDKSHFGLHPVVLEFATGELIDQVCNEILHGDLRILSSHALLKAQAKEYIRASQSRLIVLPVLDRLMAAEGKSHVERSLRQLVAKLREDHGHKPGYAGGNILNMLVQLGSELNGLDLSNLMIWQAYLVNTELRDVNFQNADLTGSALSDKFANALTLVVSPTGDFFATGDSEGVVRFWNSEDGRAILQFEAHSGWVNSIAFDPEGTILASCGGDQVIRLWQASTGQLLQTLAGHERWVDSVAFSSDGKLIASGSGDNTVKVWSVNTGECLATLRGHTGRVNRVMFDPVDNRLASASNDQTIQIWNTATAKSLMTLMGHSGAIKDLAFSPDGKYLASGSADTTVKVWDTKTGQCVATLDGHLDRVNAVAFSPDGAILASAGTDSIIRMWDFLIGQTRAVLVGHTNWVNAIAFSLDGSVVFSGSEDYTIRFWDAETAKSLKVVHGYTNEFRSVAYNSQGNVLASASDDYNVRLWNVDDGQCFEVLRGHRDRVWSVAFDPSGILLASGGHDCTIRLWEVATGRSIRVLTGHEGKIRSVTFIRNGEQLASGGDDACVRIWNAHTGECVWKLTGHEGRIRCVAHAPNSNIVASGGDDMTIRLWDTISGECISILRGHENWVRSIAFNFNGRVLISSGDDGTVRMWDVSSGRCDRRLMGHTGRVWSVAVASELGIIASGGGDSMVRLWKLDTGDPICSLINHSGQVQSVAFAAGIHEMASASEDETIIIWDIQQRILRRRLRVEQIYERANISGVKGLTQTQMEVMKSLGAVEFP